MNNTPIIKENTFTEAELIARDSERNISEELLQAVLEMQSLGYLSDNKKGLT